MRSLILGIAVVCYAAALAIAGAGMRVPVPQTTRAAQTLEPGPAAAPVPSPQPAPQPESSPVTPAAPPPQVSEGQLQATVDDLAREQAANRELVTELRTTVSLLQRELSRQNAAQRVSEAQGRTVTMLGGDSFPPGQEVLAPGATAAVLAALPEIMAAPRQIVSVEGHTDSRPVRTPAGKPFKDNATLSLLRARAVAGLLQEHGVAAERIRVKGWGDIRPLVTNDTAEGRDRNRRVEILLLPPPPEK